MKKIKLLFALVLSLSVFTACEKDDSIAIQNAPYVTFSESSLSNTGVDPNGTATVDVTIYAANTSGATLNVMVDTGATTADPGSYTVPTSVTIPAGSNTATFTVTLSDVNLGIGINNLVLMLDGGENIYEGGSITIPYFQNCTETTATLDLVFDNYPEETSWQVLDALGGVVASANAGDYDGQASATINFPLCQGRDYTFVISDVFNDGMCCTYGNGSYSLTVNGSVVASGGSFGASESTAFDTN